MKDKEFDHIIREKLDNIQTPGPVSGWEELTARMDAGQPPSVDDFDEVLFQKLHNYQGPPIEPQWESLAQRMDLVLLPSRLLRLKVLELMVLLFLLLPFTTQAPVVQPRADHHQQPGNHIKQPALAQILPFEHTPSKPDPQVEREVILGEQKREAFHTSTPKENALALLKSTPFYEVSSSKARRAAPLNLWAAVAPSQGFGTHILETVPDSKQLEASPLIPGSANQSIVLQKKAIFIQEYPRDQIRNTLFIGVSGAFNYNQVITPAQNNFEIPPVVRYHRGYSAGLSLGLGFRKWEIEGELGYTNYKYLPQQILYLEGSLVDGVYGAGVNKVELNAFNLGFGARYRVLSGENWIVSAGAGIRINSIFRSNYSVATADYFLPDFPLREPPVPINGTAEVKPTALEEKDYASGWLDNGPFFENTFLSANLNVGGEIFFSRKFSFYTRASAQPFLPIGRKGIGPDRDRIHTISLQSGFRLRIHRK